MSSKAILGLSSSVDWQDQFARKGVKEATFAVGAILMTSLVFKLMKKPNDQQKQKLKEDPVLYIPGNYFVGSLFEIVGKCVVACI